MTVPITSIDMFNLLRAKIGEQEAKALTDYVAGEVEKKYEEKKEGLASKADIYALREDVQELKGTLRTEAARLETKIAEASVANTRWMIGLFAALILLIIGLYIRR